MINPEFSNDVRQQTDRAIGNARRILQEPSSRDYAQSRFGGHGIIAGIAKAIGGQRSVRRGTLEIGGGYQWVGVSERSITRLGRTKLEQLLVFGDVMADAEGRSVDRRFSFDLTNGTYTADDLTLLNKLLESDAPERLETFNQLAGFTD